MTAVTPPVVAPTNWPPRGRPLVRADLDLMPDDGRRYELLDGVLLVTPGPVYRHQDVVGQLHLLLTAACPRELKVLLAPFDVALAGDTVLQPDLLVARRSDLTDRDLPGPPLLAVEVLSPSTARVDRLLKRDRFQQAGVPSYWLVDPVGPTVTVLELVDGAYVEVVEAAGGDDPVRLDRPFPVTVVPSALRD